jgi:hypothetical protein
MTDRTTMNVGAIASGTAGHELDSAGRGHANALVLALDGDDEGAAGRARAALMVTTQLRF